LAQDTSIRWDIIEEHLDEAAFRRQLWEQALRSFNHCLAEIAEGPEERMLSHLDGLVRGGARVARKLLVPSLLADDPGVAFAAAYSLLASEDGDFLAEVLKAMEASKPSTRPALRRALAVVPVPALGQRLASLASRVPPIHLDLVDVLGYLRVDAGARLEPLAASTTLEAQVIALRVSGFLPGRLDPSAIEQVLRSPEPALRSAALESGIVNGVRNAFGAAEAAVVEKGPAFARAALLLGLSGDERSTAILLRALSDATVRRSVVFALGFCGRVAAADALVPLLADDAIGPLAAEAFAAITGLSVEKEFAKREKPHQPTEDEQESASGPESELPRPVSETIARWWLETKQRFDPSVRWLRGRPWSLERLMLELEGGPARRREAMALDLAVRTRGHAQIAWDALSSRQRLEMTEARASIGHAGLDSYRNLPQSPARIAPKPAAAVAPAPMRRNTSVPTEALAVTGVGLVTSLGEGAAQCCAAARAGIARPSPLEDFRIVDEDEGEAEPATVHLVENAEGFVGFGKLVRLGGLALSSLVVKMDFTRGQRTGLFVAVGSDCFLSEADLDRDRSLERLGARLTEELAIPGGITEHGVFPTDAPGLIPALAAARERLAAGHLDRCLVGGVDSLAEPLVVQALAQLNLLKTPDSPTGLMPGEGAAFLLIERVEEVRRRKAAVLAWIDAIALRTDAPTSFSGAAMDGTSLSAVISESVAGRGGDRSKLFICDLNGTTARALDWGHAQVRVPQTTFVPAAQWIPALHFGELGAATGPIAVALAAEGFARGRSPSQDAVVWLWSDAGHRAALLVRAP
jgi:uncharacterized protein (TIGR02270 family)